MESGPEPREGYIPVDNARLFYREIGQGRPIIVLHGGPDFDHRYLLPDMDRLAGSYRLIYYDQRGRGQSGGIGREVQPEEVSIQSEMDDLERLREHFGLESVVILGHSWGALLAMEYAIRHTRRVSHLILMNSAPASSSDYMLFRQERHKSVPEDFEMLRAISAEPEYVQGDPDAVAAYCRIHFRVTVRQPEHLEKVVKSLRASFTREGILRARKIAEHLANETWLSGTYDLLPALKELGAEVPTLLIHGEHDFIPLECAVHISEAISGSRLVLLPGCGHFSYLECPDEVSSAIDELLRSS